MSRRLFLLGEIISYDQLQKTNFVDFWSDDINNLTRIVNELMTVLDQNAPMAVKGMKKILRELEKDKLNDREAKTAILNCFASEHHAEALKARLENRKPIFKDK